VLGGEAGDVAGELGRAALDELGDRPHCGDDRGGEGGGAEPASPVGGVGGVLELVVELGGVLVARRRVFG